MTSHGIIIALFASIHKIIDRKRQKGKNLDAMKVEGIAIKLEPDQRVNSGPGQPGPRQVLFKEKWRRY